MHDLIKIAFITPSVSRSAGGIFEMELALAKELHKSHQHIEVHSEYDQNTHNDLSKWLPLTPNLYHSVGPHAFRYSPSLRKNFIKNTCDIVHLQTMWMYTSMVVNAWYKRHKRPYIISPHGMLDIWALRNSSWKKKIVSVLYENTCLRNATCIHALNMQEYHSIREYGLSNPVAIIPNGVYMPEKKPFTSSEKKKKVLLYLGRLHEKKGIVELIDAWRRIDSREWELHITGWADKDFDALLYKKLESNNIKNIVITGPKFDHEKHIAYSKASAFILPSFSEGLPMSVLEAWAYRLPVVMTEACNLSKGFEKEAALKTDATAESIASTLLTLFSLSNRDLTEMGNRGYQLVLDEYTWDKVAGQMYTVYKWMLGQHSKPDFVI